jgi:hypothetical protein
MPSSRFAPRNRAQLAPRELDGGGPYRGHDCVRNWWQNLLGTSPDFSGEIEGVLGLGDVTVVRLRLRGHRVGSDASMKHTSWSSPRRSRKAIWWGVFRSEAEAREAAELWE